MNRPIKFRLWNTQYSQWMNHCAVIDAAGRAYSSFVTKYADGRCEQMLVPLAESQNIVQQFTGLLDKNGKEIYEGDIIRGTEIACAARLIGVVGFDTFGIFYTKVTNYPSESYENCLGFSQEYNEVIGNIFENPELLSDQLS